MTNKDKNIAILLYIVLWLISFSSFTTLASNVFKYLKQDHEIKGLFSNIFGLCCIASFYFKYFPAYVNSKSDITLDKIMQLKKCLNNMIWVAGIFCAMLTILQVGFLFGAYKEDVPPLLYVGSIILVIFLMWGSKYFNVLLKKSNYNEEITSPMN
jgi:cytochrome bd-type quinol oxidase subunit 2